MKINKYCECGAYLGEIETKNNKIIFDIETLNKDNGVYKCKVCSKSLLGGNNL